MYGLRVHWMGHYVMMFWHPIIWTTEKILCLLKFADLGISRQMHPPSHYTGQCRPSLKCSMWIPKFQSSLGWRTDTGLMYVCTQIFNPSLAWITTSVISGSVVSTDELPSLCCKCPSLPQVQIEHYEINRGCYSMASEPEICISKFQGCST